MISGTGISRTASSYVPTGNNSFRFRTFHTESGHGCSGNTGSSSSLSASLPPPSSLSFSTQPLLLARGSDEIDSTMFLLPDNPLLSPIFIAILALLLLVSAQSFINKMLEGDRGLGAFLKDGSGYNRSGFSASGGSDKDSGTGDPLPWLKLPRLDFVEVAGQKEATMREEEEQRMVYEELDRLRLRLNRELENVKRRREDGSGREDDTAEATRLRTKLEGLMTRYGIEYETE